ncbi:hypothetical protein AA106555_1012 [Neokomagataea thailandica NBRC 106555]|uniref:Uncharacterized protein n=2 Tax=Neokomagataea TaxID=1223423 RepID=A0A4Y6V6F2_9PROT|nr:hypothetical protein D5366_01680 [Neokomagataea tanensis]GBR52720.1 hypothetical protein AA106555_1012 [Neokomagataea thailandica NBRC 106555]
MSNLCQKSLKLRQCACRTVKESGALIEDLVVDQPWLWLLVAAGVGMLIGRFVWSRKKTSE